jgi:hypothetical protein
MNEELIKRLIGSASDTDFTENKILWESAGTIYYKEHLIRLIELVVKECVSVVNDQPWSDPHEVYQAVDLIENHFGGMT